VDSALQAPGYMDLALQETWISSVENVNLALKALLIQPFSLFGSALQVYEGSDSSDPLDSSYRVLSSYCMLPMLRSLE
jgi:hypothetical protein